MNAYFYNLFGTINYNAKNPENKKPAGIWQVSYEYY